MIAPSAQWQQWIFIAALAWLLFEMWRGWRLGLIRGVLRIIILVAAWVAASAAAASTTTALALFFQRPSSLLPTVAAVIVGFAIYLLGAFLSGLLLKRTEHHHGLLRGILGIGGACCGLLFGLFFLWGGVSLIRTLGLFGEMRLLEARHQGRSITNDTLACNLVRLEKSLEMGPTGQFLITTDPLSTTFYDNTRKSMAVMQNPEVLRRFLQAPSAQKILQNDSMMQLLHDPEIQEELRSGSILALMHNQHVEAIFHDSKLMQQLKEFDLTSALNYALKKSPPSQEREQPPETTPEPSSEEPLR